MQCSPVINVICHNEQISYITSCQAVTSITDNSMSNESVKDLATVPQLGMCHLKIHGTNRRHFLLVSLPKVAI